MDTRIDGSGEGNGMRILIMGAGGFAREVADLCADLGHEVAAMYAEEPESSEVNGIPVVTELDAVSFDSAVIAVGDSTVRKRWWEMLDSAARCEPLIHPSAYVSPSATLGNGTTVMQNAVVTANAVIGGNSLLNVGCYVAHDCTIGAHTHVAGGVNLGGYASVGEGCLLGTGAILLPSASVGDWVTCGAGAVILDNVPSRDTVAGIPARSIDVKL